MSGGPSSRDNYRDQQWKDPMFKRVTAFAYGLACYLVFFLTFLYAIGFVGNILVPKSIDAVSGRPVMEALAIDAALLAIFAIQHSVMARRWFKQAWTRIVPEPVERSTYVLFSSLALIAMFFYWEPVGGVLWSVEQPVFVAAMYATYALGAAIVLVSTFLINHFDLFGLRQVWLYLMGRPYTHLPFRTPLFYKYVRHPLYFGWLLFFWAAPVMTATHLFFAVMTTAYIFVAIQFEERDLVQAYGETYRQYRERVPMIFPVGEPQIKEAEKATT
jgi:protein-S-isoprenylcysteine O-methyltransferase Ste14